MCERNKKYTEEPQRINGGGLSISTPRNSMGSAYWCRRW